MMIVMSDETRKQIAWIVDFIGTIVLILTLLMGLMNTLILDTSVVSELVVGTSLKALGVGLYVKA